jgi:hypothetical protein
MEKISWTTIEYLHSHKTTDWYWIVGAVAVSIAIISIIFNNIIFAILILVAAFTLAMFASRPPQEIPVEISGAGILVNRTLYPYTELDSFWIELNEVHPKMIIKSKRLLMHYIVVFLDPSEASPEEVHGMLSRYLREEHHSEPFLEKLLVYLGF